MPVDDAILKTTLESANQKLTINGIERSKLKIFIQSCIGITAVPTREDPKVMKDIMDKNLGTKMSTVRRQAIYDKIIADKTPLGL